MVKKITEILKYKNQVILQGAPGTGKTYNAKNVAYHLVLDKELSNKKEERKTMKF